MTNLGAKEASVPNPGQFAKLDHAVKIVSPAPLEDVKAAAIRRDEFLGMLPEGYRDRLIGLLGQDNDWAVELVFNPPSSFPLSPARLHAALDIIEAALEVLRLMYREVARVERQRHSGDWYAA